MLHIVGDAHSIGYGAFSPNQELAEAMGLKLMQSNNLSSLFHEMKLDVKHITLLLSNVAVAGAVAWRRYVSPTTLQLLTA